MATAVTGDESRELEETTGAGTDAMTEARRVVEPDLLWIESVTDRLLGSAGRPAAWERVYFEGPDVDAAEPADETAAAPLAPSSSQPATPSPAGGNPVAEAPADAPAHQPLPQRTPRAFEGPVSYRQPAGYVPPASVHPQTEPVAAQAPPGEDSPAERSPGEPPAVGDPATWSEDHGVRDADPHHQEPPLSAVPSPTPSAAPSPEPIPVPSPVDLAPTGPHLREVPPPSAVLVREPVAGAPSAGPPYTEPSPPEPSHAEPPRTEEMPPAVLRAALRDALPDVLSLPSASGPADAVFGDPRWNLPAEDADDEPGEPPRVEEPTEATPPVDAPAAAAEAAAEPAPVTDETGPAASALAEGAADVPDQVLTDESAPLEDVPEASSADLPGEDADRLAAAAEATEPGDQSFADEPVQSPYFAPPTPDGATAASADLRHGYPRPPEALTVADVALRLAFRSQDRELAEAVVRLVARQGRERARLRTAEAYLDAILDEGSAALPGAARLRHILAD